MLDGRAAAPHVHHDEDQRGHQHGEIAAVEELGEAREEEHALDQHEEDQEAQGEHRLVADPAEIDEEQDRGHQHGRRDGQTVGRLHVRGGLEEQDDKDAAAPDDVVDQRNEELALCLRGVDDPHVRHEVQVDRLGDDGEGACDQRLRRNDGGEGGQQHGEDAQLRRDHLEEGVEVGHREHFGVVHMAEDEGALAQVVEDEGRLDEGPGGIDVGLAHMPHVGIEGLRASGAEEDVAQDHEARGIGVGEEEHETAHRVERAQDAPVAGLDDVHHAHDRQEGEPQSHDRAEELADRGGARALDSKEHAEDGNGDHHDDALVVADDAIDEVDRAQALDRGRDGDGRGEDAVGEQGRTADHGREEEPFAAALDQAIEGEDAALVVVVGLHGNEDVLDGGDERDRPDEQRQRAEHDVLAHGGKAAVASHDRLEGVHRARADVTVHDPERHEHHAHGEGDARIGVLAFLLEIPHRGGRCRRAAAADV